MRKITVLALVFSAIFSFGAPLAANTADGSTPAAEGVCNGLKADGVTKGLYGLCVAYCEAEARSDAVLAAYDRKRGEDDPAMPCLCPCWGAIEAYEGASPQCTFDPEIVELTYTFPTPDIIFDSYGVTQDSETEYTCGHVLFPLVGAPETLFENIDAQEAEGCIATIAVACPDE